MHPDDEWDTIHKDRGLLFGEASVGLLRLTLLFGSVAIAFALIIAPIVGKQSNSAVYATGVDTMSTGTIGSGANSTYTIRKSVLQPSPDSVCIIRANGARSGDC